MGGIPDKRFPSCGPSLEHSAEGGNANKVSWNLISNRRCKQSSIVHSDRENQFPNVENNVNKTMELQTPRYTLQFVFAL